MAANQGIIDILRCAAATFTVDVDVDDVAVTATQNFFITPGVGLYYFQPKDNFRILSAWICLPYCFCVSVPQFELVLEGRDSAPTTFTIPQVGSVKSNWIPVENTETELDLYVPFSVSPASLKYGIYGKVDTGRINMFNVPIGLDNDVLTIYAYLKVAHNLPLIA